MAAFTGSMASVLAGALALPALAEPPAVEHPAWSLGDTWVFHERSSPPPADSQWSRKVVDRTPSGGFRVQTKDGGYLRFDDEGNSLDGRGPEYTWHRFRFPMSIGSTWSYERKINQEPHEGTERATFKVVAYEKITVPAGTYDCYKVEGEAYRAWTGSMYTSYLRGSQQTTYWYCPAVKWAAKWETTTIPYVSSPPVHSSSELLSFETKP